MNIQESVELQKFISDPNIDMERAIDALMTFAGMTEPAARQRILISRGLIPPDDQVE